MKRRYENFIGQLVSDFSENARARKFLKYSNVWVNFFVRARRIPKNTCTVGQYVKIEMNINSIMYYIILYYIILYYIILYYYYYYYLFIYLFIRGFSFLLYKNFSNFLPLYKVFLSFYSHVHSSGHWTINFKTFYFKNKIQICFYKTY